MGIALGVEEVPLLRDHGLQTLAVDEVVSWVLDEGFVFFTFFEERTHVDEDFVDFTLFLEVAGRLLWLLAFVVGEFSHFKSNELGWFEFAELLDMMSSPSRVREITVPWYEIVAVSFFDVEVLEDGGLGHSVVEDECAVDVSGLIVGLVWSCADFNTSAQNVSKLSSVPFALKGCQESVIVFVSLHVEAGVPLTVLVLVVDGLGRNGRHCEVSAPMPMYRLMDSSNCSKSLSSCTLNLASHCLSSVVKGTEESRDPSI